VGTANQPRQTVPGTRKKSAQSGSL
jgi:hypothetical protein